MPFTSREIRALVPSGAPAIAQRKHSNRAISLYFFYLVHANNKTNKESSPVESQGVRYTVESYLACVMTNDNVAIMASEKT